MADRDGTAPQRERSRGRSETRSRRSPEAQGVDTSRIERLETQVARLSDSLISLGPALQQVIQLSVLLPRLIRSRSFYRSLLQARYKVNSGAGYYLAWANNTYGLCCLRAYFCAHTVIRARSYEVTHQKGIGIAMGFLLQKRMNWLRALFSKGCRRWC